MIVCLLVLNSVLLSIVKELVTFENIISTVGIPLLNFQKTFICYHHQPTTVLWLNLLYVLIQ